MPKPSLLRKKNSSSIIPGVFRRAGRTVRKGVKKGVYAGKVGAATLGLAKDIANPVNQAKMIKGAIQGKGVLVPGSKYIGPGNAMNKGKPNSTADEAAYQHDLDYGRLLSQGVSKKKLYGGFSKADERLMKRADLTTKHGVAAYGGMAVKKGLYKLGLSGKKTGDGPGGKGELYKGNYK
jgi:hypothetical protein